MSINGRISGKNAVLLLQHKTDNSVCADCTKENPRFVCVIKGLFLCHECCGVHRSFGTQVSRIKSIDTDFWSEEVLEFMQEHGNEKGNAIWTKQVPVCYRRPKPSDPRVLREQWIRAKYERREFVDGAAPPAYLSGSMKGHLMKKGKDKSSWNKRLFVLSEAQNCLAYYIQDQDRAPKQSFRLTEINVTFAEERTDKENSLQITYVTDGKTRNYFVCQDSGKEIVDWYMAIRSAKLNFLRHNKPCIDVETLLQSSLADKEKKQQLAAQVTRDFTMEGFLEKTGPKNEPFQNRWFTLDGRRLLYFKEPMDPHAKGELILGSDNEGFRVHEGVTDSRYNDEDYCFTLVTPGRNFILKAKTENERKMWIDCLSNVVLQPMTEEDKKEMAATLEASKKRKTSLKRFRVYSFSKDEDSP